MVDASTLNHHQQQTHVMEIGNRGGQRLCDVSDVPIPVVQRLVKVEQLQESQHGYDTMTAAIALILCVAED